MLPSLVINNLRLQMLLALLLDIVGQLVTLGLILRLPTHFGWVLGGNSLEGQWNWLVFSLLIYPSLGWLLGSYTVFRLRSLTFIRHFLRVLTTSIACISLVALAAWLFNSPETVWLVYRRVQVVWMFLLTGWSCLVRVALWKGFLLPETPLLLLFENQRNISTVIATWRSVSHRQYLQSIDVHAL